MRSSCSCSATRGAEPAGVPAAFKLADRAVLAALARRLPRERWASLIVCPATVRRWHRDALARRWTYPQRAQGRPPVEAGVAKLRAINRPA